MTELAAMVMVLVVDPWVRTIDPEKVSPPAAPLTVRLPVEAVPAFAIAVVVPVRVVGLAVRSRVFETVTPVELSAPVKLRMVVEPEPSRPLTRSWWSSVRRGPG